MNGSTIAMNGSTIAMNGSTIAMNGSTIVLPTNQRYRNIVFTYVHSENTLNCGDTAIKSPAVSSLKRAAPINNPLPISDFIEAKK